MRRPIEPPQSEAPDEHAIQDDSTSSGERAGPSKTRRKAEMHALQDLGEALVSLAPEKMRSLDLPERLADAVSEARGITKWEARRRQMQYIGRLMRDIDPQPLRDQLARWAEGPQMERAQLHRVERWRTRLLNETDALDQLCAQVPEIDRAHVATLVQRTRHESAHGGPPRASRELFRYLNARLGEARST
jgi:ribosome-associated protein